ncbi:hypothetical protein LCGC14_0756670 [marine sediment metagenome]|uniref:Uncharacterized protein n=1 Tax=marine sediment metagenome TaxID=412755 RepID=A0A0F9SMJ3_9ZZZZ
MTETTKKLNMNQIFAAAINESVEKKLIISPKAVAEVDQNSQIKMALDVNGNFVLTVEEK